MKGKKIMKDIIFLAANGNYTQHVGVTIQSVIENNKERNFEFHLIYSGLNQLDKLIENAKRNKYDLILHEVNEEDFKGYPISNHISYSTYYRFLIPKYINETVEKVLYIDSDLLVVGSLKELLELEMGNNYIAAGLDKYCSDIAKVVLGMPKNYDYFNAGVMLLNMKKIREDKIFEKAVHFMLNNLDKIKWHDQDALNAVINNKVIVLNKKWNLNSYYFNVENVDYTKCDCRIVHFTGPLKPWDKALIHPMKDYYYDYLKNTVFFNGDLYSAKNESVFIKILRKNKVLAYRVLRKLFSKNKFTREHIFFPINDKFNLNKVLFNKFKCDTVKLSTYKDKVKVIDQYGCVSIEGRVKYGVKNIKVKFVHDLHEEYDFEKEAVIDMEEETFELSINKDLLKHGAYQIMIIQGSEIQYSEIIHIHNYRSNRIMAAIDEITYYSKYIKVHGWIILEHFNAFNFEKKIILENENGRCYEYDLKMVERRDITEFMNQKYNYDDAGFLIYINKSSMDVGLYTINLELIGPNGMKITKTMNDYLEID